MPEGTAEWFRGRRGSGCVVAGRTRFAIPAVARAGFGRLNQGQPLARDLTRGQGRRFSLTNLRPADQAGASVLSHASGERHGPLVGTIGLPAQPQSAGE
jgi:cold shock CspA family protein